MVDTYNKTIENQLKGINANLKDISEQLKELNKTFKETGKEFKKMCIVENRLQDIRNKAEYHNKLEKEIKKYTSEGLLSNKEIAEKLGISESSVRTYRM